MRVRDIVIPFMTGMLIFGLNVFNSCASSSVTDEDSQMTVPDGSKSPVGSDFGGAAPKSESDEMQALAEIPEEGEIPPPAPQARVEPPQPRVEAKAPAKSLEEQTSYIPSDIPPPAAVEAAPPAAAPETAPPPTTVAENPAPRSGVGSSRVPKIPSDAIKKGKDSLNRFYFTRAGDSPKKVSQLLYGDKKHAKKLVKWNGAGWQAGKVVYYQSATQPEEPQMRSFYQERNVPTEDYEVKKGDWLSRIAGKRLGSVNSWKELAVTNGIEKPTKIEPGQKLALFPKDLSPYGAAAGEAPPAVASTGGIGAGGGGEPNPRPTPEQAEAPAAPVAKAPAPGTPPAVEIPGGADEQPGLGAVAGNTEGVTPPAEQPAFLKNKKKQKTASFDVMQFLDQNLLFGIVFLLLLVLLGALFIVNKRKKAGAEDFGDDGFTAKARRR